MLLSKGESGDGLKRMCISNSDLLEDAIDINDQEDDVMNADFYRHKYGCDA